MYVHNACSLLYSLAILTHGIDDWRWLHCLLPQRTNHFLRSGQIRQELPRPNYFTAIENSSSGNGCGTFAVTELGSGTCLPHFSMVPPLPSTRPPVFTPSVVTGHSFSWRGSERMQSSVVAMDRCQDGCSNAPRYAFLTDLTHP